MLSRNMVDKPETESKALTSISDAGKPVSVDYVAHATGLAWHQARSLLFRLVAEGKISMLDTTKSWVFFPLKIEKIKEGVKFPDSTPQIQQIPPTQEAVSNES